jgi:hypothetical protein
VRPDGLVVVAPASADPAAGSQVGRGRITAAVLSLQGRWVVVGDCPGRRALQAKPIEEESTC